MRLWPSPGETCAHSATLRAPLNGIPGNLSGWPQANEREHARGARLSTRRRPRRRAAPPLIRFNLNHGGAPAAASGNSRTARLFALSLGAGALKFAAANVGVAFSSTRVFSGALRFQRALVLRPFRMERDGDGDGMREPKVASAALNSRARLCLLI